MISTPTRTETTSIVPPSHEVELAGHRRFGDADEIVHRVLSFYHRGLNLLSDRLTGAAELGNELRGRSVASIYRVLGDPVVRSAISGALLAHKEARLEADDPAGAVLSTASRYLEGHGGPTEEETGASVRIGRGLEGFWLWPETPRDGLLTNRFLELFKEEIATSISTGPAILRDPTPAMLDHLSRGHGLLRTLLPDLSRSLLSHVHLVGIVDVADRSLWKGQVRANLCQNVSTHAMPGTIFLSPTPLRGPWHAAEALFHEACHKKLSDLVLTSSVFQAGFAAASSPTVLAVWNRDLSWNSNRWSIDRALFALHFYVHLALFHQAVGARSGDLDARYGSPPWTDPKAAARSALDRARYLAREIEVEEAGSLGDVGRDLLTWLRRTLDAMDPQPPLEDPTVHLALDRFDRETEHLGALLRKIPEGAADYGSLATDAPYGEWQVGRIADHLIHSTIVSCYRLLAVLGEPDEPRFPFYHGDLWSVQAGSGLPLARRADVLAGLRTFISSTTRGASEDLYERAGEIEGPMTFRDLVIDMVEHAGRHTDDLLAQVRSWRRQARSGARP